MTVADKITALRAALKSLIAACGITRSGDLAIEAESRAPVVKAIERAQAILSITREAPPNFVEPRGEHPDAR